MSAQAAADALLAAAQVPGGFVVEYVGSVFRVSSKYDPNCCGCGVSLDDAVVAYVAHRDWVDATRAAFERELDRAESSNVTLLTSKAGQ